MKSIGIDIGTTTISFAVTDNDTLAVIQKYTIASAGFIHTENPWERIQDTDVILSRIRPVLNDILDTYSDISAIGITSQMHGIGLRTGHPFIQCQERTCPCRCIDFLHDRRLSGHGTHRPKVAPRPYQSGCRYGTV